MALASYREDSGGNNHRQLLFYQYTGMNYSEILVKIRSIVRLVNLESKRIEKEYGISIPQLLCLKFLHDQPEFSASHKAIKNFLHLNASTVTGIITRLEKKGLIARLPKTKDKRVSLIIITQKGANLIQEGSGLPLQRITDKFQHMSPQQQNEIQQAFERILSLLEWPNPQEDFSVKEKE